MTTTMSEKRQADYRHALLMETIRKGEGKFGAVPLTDLKKLLNTPNTSLEMDGQGPEFMTHPLLKQSQQHCGDADLSSDITINKVARSHPELALRLRNQLDNALRQKRSKLPTLGR